MDGWMDGWPVQLFKLAISLLMVLKRNNQFAFCSFPSGTHFNLETYSLKCDKHTQPYLSQYILTRFGDCDFVRIQQCETFIHHTHTSVHIFIQKPRIKKKRQQKIKAKQNIYLYRQRILYI